MKLNRILTGFLAGVLAMTMVVTDVVATSNVAAAQTPNTPSIMLNGTVDAGEPGYLSPKSTMLSSGSETRINYRLVPSYSSGQASAVRVTLFMPSLELMDGEYRVVGRDAEPGAMGIEGRASAGGDWVIVSDTVSQGGALVLEYDGDLRAGANPGFDVFLKTYNDGTDGPYGSVPEGTPFEVTGFVSYEAFNQVDGTRWETPAQLDDDSRVSVITSDLQWEPTIAPYLADSDSPSVPMWDRYQYIDYLYTLENVSTNAASDIDGYSVTFDIDTTDNINGIIPSDINKFIYGEGGVAIPNDDPNITEGQFIGVPGEGGVLIHDVTDWDGTSELTNPVPYRYSGAGVIVIDREHGEEKQALKPGQDRTFLVSLPMSRQGFPNLPTNFTMVAITNILFAKTANWTKTRTAVREIVNPTYGFDFTHAPQQASTTYGVETFTEISGITNTSNAPIFDPELVYAVPEDYSPDRVVLEFNPKDLDRFVDIEASYVVTDPKKGDEVVTVPGVVGETDAVTPGNTTITFDVSALPTKGNRELTFTTLADRMSAGSTLPLLMRLYGTPFSTGTMTVPAVATYVERFANNEDYTQDTTYEDVDHTVQEDATFDVALPHELHPAVEVIGVYGDRRTTGSTLVPYEAELQAEYQLSTNDVVSPEFTYTIDAQDPTKSAGRLSPTSITLTDAFLAAVTDPVVTVIDVDGNEAVFRKRDVSMSETGLDNVAKIVIAGTQLTMVSLQTIAVVNYESALDMGAKQSLRATFAGHQTPPYTEVKKATQTNTVEVRESKTTTKIEGVNQPTKALGAGTSYDQWVDRLWYCTSSGCGSKTDYTLDQGYKSLGGFTSSITRPTQVYENNDETVVVDVAVPHEQFDLYYLKVRDDLQPFLQDVTIYRLVDGEEVLWKSIDGASWVNNTTEGNFWRIATAQPEIADADLFTTQPVSDGAPHPYYKEPFAADVVPDQPVSRISLTLAFERVGATDRPQLSGTTNRVVEYMGRFYATSEEGRKPTTQTVVDTIGTTAPIIRTHIAAPIYSMVSYAYAQSRTGAQDSTSTAKKFVSLGDEGHYLGSIWNVNTGAWYAYNGHGPDVYSPAWTEFDEWLYHYDPSSFHDKLAYEFVYPASPQVDKDFNFEVTDIELVNTSMMRYLTNVRIEYKNGEKTESVTLPIDDALRAQLITQPQLRIVYDDSRAVGFHSVDASTFAVSLGEGNYPTKFEAVLEAVAGFGDNTAELAGVAGDSLGANLNEIDVRVGGVVNGNKDLVGTTNIYRMPNDSERMRTHTSSAILAGYTPKLGATMDMNFNALETYDYTIGGVEATETTVGAGMRNASEADISGFTMTVVVDKAMRSEMLEIPAAVFNDRWETKKVVLKQPGNATGVEIDLDLFSLNTETQRYELNISALFDDGTLATKELSVNFGGQSTLQQREVSEVVVEFAAQRDENDKPVARMWGSLARERDETLPARMIDGSYVFITGDWVDETAQGDNWESKPSYRNEGLHVNSGSVYYSSFTVKAAHITTPQRFTTPNNGSNSNVTPTLTYNSASTAPYLRHRQSSLDLLGTHLNDDLTLAGSGRLYPFDADTNAQVSANDLVVGDTTKVLYQLRNDAKANQGLNPVFSPRAHFTAPAGLDITGVDVISDASSEALKQLIADAGHTLVPVPAENVTITDGPNGKKLKNVAFTGVTLAEQESVFVLVEYTAVNDFGAELTATQNKTVGAYSYARPGYQHHLQNYAADGVSGGGINRSENITGDYDQDGKNEVLARVSASYRYANVTDLSVTSTFDIESVSGTPMTVTLDDVSNQVRHDNTEATLDIVLNTRAHGFVLSELPVPEYPANFTGDFAAPILTIKVGSAWVAYNEDEHDLADVNELRIEYGTLPAFVGDSATPFVVPAISLKGTGYWQNYGGDSSKSSQITTSATLTLTHRDGSAEGNPAVAAYAVTKTATSTIYKPMPVVELNLQSFDTRAEAEVPYSNQSASAVGKVTYEPGDPVHVKLTARNANTAAATNTGEGKASLLAPVIFDKVPEYVSTGLSAYVADGTLDVAAAVAAGDLTVNHYDSNGDLRDDVTLPTATVTVATGLDVGGDQTFSNDRHNDSWGLLSSKEPSDTGVNPAREIEFETFTYAFADDLARGERIEIVYSGKIREDNLPFATYENGRAVYAPLLGWYIGNVPVSSNAHQYDMDMASLLHDAGISGTRSAETTANEFLMNSFAWQSGSIESRRHPSSSSGVQDTYYDSSANSMYSHKAYLKETTGNTLFESATGTARDDNFGFVGAARVNNGTVQHSERILWAQDSLQLTRAWLYGASEMVPDVEREGPSGLSTANFYEHDGSLEAPTYITPYTTDNYTYAVQLHEEFTARLHAANLGDRAIASGIEYLEVLPIGVSPLDANGDLLGVTAFNGDGSAIDAGRVTVELVQTPTADAGYRAPAQSQEAGTFADGTIADAIPYVVRVRVEGELGGMFNASSATTESKYQYVDVRVVVDGDAPTVVDGTRYFHDELTVTTIAAESYVEIYSDEYGAFDRAPSVYNPAKFPNDGMPQGVDVTDLRYSFNSHSSFFSFEPYGVYVRGLNAQSTVTVADGKPALVTGDQIAMRAASLRVWNSVQKDDADYQPGYPRSAQEFTVALNEQFTIHAAVENQQVETSADYNLTSGPYDRELNQTQTTGGARGSWFDPSVTVTLPYGVVPVLANGKIARYHGDVDNQQNVAFTAAINDVTYKTSDLATDVTDSLDVRVERVSGDAGDRFVLFFTIKDTPEARAAVHEVRFGQALVVSPRVAAIDVAAYGQNVGVEAEHAMYQQIITVAQSEREVFEPVLTPYYATGSAPMGVTADRSRRDSTGVDGALKITERLISPTTLFSHRDEIALHTAGTWNVAAETLLTDRVPAVESNNGAWGGTQLAVRQPTIVNQTQVGPYADGPMSEMLLTDTAGRFWVSTRVDNRPAPNSDPYERLKDSGDVLNSRFLVTTQITSLAEKTTQVRLRIDGTILERAEFEALGYTVEAVTADERDGAGDRQSVQWLVTTPDAGNGTRGHLASGDSIELMQQYQLVDGFDSEGENKDPWNDESLTIDAYVSLITDDRTLIRGWQNAADFIVQAPGAMHYENLVTEGAGTGDIDADGEHVSFFAHDSARIEIAKPAGEVRVNTTRPRLEYSNGITGDTYFNSADTIEYLTTYAKNTGSGVKELVVEHILPTYESNDDSVQTSKEKLNTTLLYVTSGAWEVPLSTRERLDLMGKSVDDVFETEVFVSTAPAENGYETGQWTSLGTSSVLTNTRFDVPAALRAGQSKVRIVVRSLDADFLVPTGMRLAIDADPHADGAQEVVETDPGNKSVNRYPDGVTSNAAKIGMRAASDKKATLFIWDTAQLWANSVAEARVKLDQSETRAYLTPSRPVVNVFHDALYYRSDASKPQAERYGWSANTAIKPDVSPHLKFRGEVVNADNTMWNEDTEGDTYSADTLINPIVSFELPAVMAVSDAFTYVPSSDITAGHPLSDDHRTRYPLTDDSAHLWTWKLVRADGSEASADSYLKHARIHSGAWQGMDRNVVTVWFEGQVFPGDKIVVDFIGKIDAYTPGAASDDLKSRVFTTNNTGLVQPLNSEGNRDNRLGYTTDRSDLDDNRLLNDRLVFAERVLFEYETYDNFGKRKVSYSDLNRAGTVWPQITPVREGGTFSFTVSLDNTKEAVDTPYPYPIMYDVLPFVGDTSIMNANVPRNSQQSALLDVDSISLSVEGTENRVYGASEYTAYVGPFTMQDGVIVAADMVTQADAATEAFFDDLGTPAGASAVRDAHFVTVSEFRAAVEMNPQLLAQARTLLVMFNSASASLPGQSKLKLDYDMTVPLNAPVFLETWNAEGAPGDYAQWNSFVGTQRKPSFKPQESNLAGAYVTERFGSVSIGNYVWHDANINAVQDEGEMFVDDNGRTLLRPSKDIDHDGTVDDPGINGVTVTLLTANGNFVDALGRPIAQVGENWVVIDDATGAVSEDDLGQTTPSEGPLLAVTRDDVHGHAGYYVFSNIAPGDYRAMFEFPGEFARFSVTTLDVLSGAGVEVFEPGEEAGIPAGDSRDALVAITETASVTVETSDDVRMGFDLGVAEMIDVGGTVWNDTNRNGTIDAGEEGLAGYTVYLQDTAGGQVLDENGDPFVATTGADGSYVFTLLPRQREYQIQVTHPGGQYDAGMPVTPIMHSHDPFEFSDDNDGFVTKSGDARTVITNSLDFSIESLHASAMADRLSVNVGFYQRQETGVIGNRVWNDLDRDGIQDAGEPGIIGQELALEQFELIDGDWVKNASFSATAVSGADGYYFFRDVPAYRIEGADRAELRYQVVVGESGLVAGHTFAPTHQGDRADLDSDFYVETGTMHATAAMGENLIVIAATDAGDPIAVDDVTIDLGLMAHDTGVIAGEVFIDETADGTKAGDQRAAERFTATLQQSQDGVTWVDAATQVAANSYRFDGLAILDEATHLTNQYRVVISEIPLWLAVTSPNVGGDDTVDSDFVEQGRGATITAVSDVHVLGERTQGQFFPINTRDSIDQEDVDLGLVTPVAVVGGLMWDDANANGIREAGEAPLPGETIVLQELIAGEWVNVPAAGQTIADVIGSQLGASTLTVMTDANGEYRFDVSPLHYEDESDARFLQPRLYRAVAVRDAHEVWSPLNVGDDVTIDSDIIAPGPDQGYRDWAGTNVFSIIDYEDGIADPTTMRDDVQMDIGVTSYPTEVEVGGRVWEDENSDGIQQEDEQRIAGHVVTLQERVDGTWTIVEDLTGSSTSETDASGRYAFTVAPTHYGEDHPLFLQPREYRVVSDRLGYQEWSPAFVGDDRAVDSNIEAETSGMALRGYADTFSIIDAVNDRADVTTVRDDRETDIGLTTHPHTVELGGTAWIDSVEDGSADESEQRLGGQKVTLWEKVDGEWIIASDVDGESVRETDDNGAYAFVVYPTHFDATHVGFMKPREYRTTMATPEGYRLSVGDRVTTEPFENDAVTTIAAINTVDEHGVISLTALTDDKQLHFPFVPLPVTIPGETPEEELAVTGAQVITGVAISVLLLAGAGILLLIVTRRRKHELGRGRQA